MSIGSLTFNGFDVVVLLILLISLIIAVQRGFLREVMSLLALFIAGVAALFVWGRFRYSAQDFISPSWLADVALGAGTFTLIYLIGVFILTKIFGKLDAPSTKFINRALGAAFGVLRGLIIASLIVLVLTSSNRSSMEAQETRSKLEQRGLYDEFRTTYPQSFQDQMEKGITPPPEYLANSTFYPMLNNIGNMIMKLPFAEMRSYADRIKDGDIDGIRREIIQ
jgi:membrane protein required for colicin V production